MGPPAPPPGPPPQPRSPGHSWVLQGSSCVGGPSQKSPWPWGAGLEQARLRLRTPAPQLRLQLLQGLQGLQPPGPAAQGVVQHPAQPPRTPTPPGGHSQAQGCRTQGRSSDCGSGQGAPGCGVQKRYRRWWPGPQEAEHSLQGVQGVQGVWGSPSAPGRGHQRGPRVGRCGGTGATWSSPRGRSPHFGTHPSVLGQIPFPSSPIFGQTLPFGRIPPFWAHPPILGTSLLFGAHPSLLGQVAPFGTNPSLLGQIPGQRGSQTPPHTPVTITPPQAPGPPATGDSRDGSPRGHQGRVRGCPCSHPAMPRSGGTAGAGGGLTVTTSHLGAVGDPAGDAGAGDRGRRLGGGLQQPGTPPPDEH